ncbi:MAG: signal peptidase I [Thermoanaerobaculia bacterium]
MTFPTARAFVSIVRVIVQPLSIGIIAALVVRATLLQAYSIPSASMAPTLEPGDHILVTPFGEVDRGDVVVFRNPGVGPGYFVKRIVATAGDYIEIRGGSVWINGRRAEEPYLPPGVGTTGRVADLVPDGHVFVMGDHRADSIDSRAWGFLPEERIVGRARLIFWSAGGVETASAHSRGGEGWVSAPRWRRMLRVIR